MRHNRKTETTTDTNTNTTTSLPPHLHSTVTPHHHHLLNLSSIIISSPVGCSLSDPAREMEGAVGFLILLLLASRGFGGAEGYKNYTVGDDLGWYDRSAVPKVDYQKWAAGKTFGLGDFLIFNTDKNHSVIQTYNATVYKTCDYSDAQDNDTLSFSAGEPTAAREAVTFAVPLVREGANYFFSGDYDGEQCRNGQQFQVNVTHGQGLPESLQMPTAGAASPAPADDDGAVPDTVVPSNFNNPQGVGEVNAPPSAAAGAMIETAVRLGSILCGLTALIVS